MTCLISWRSPLRIPSKGRRLHGGLPGSLFSDNVWLARGDLTKTKDEYQRALHDIPNYADALDGMGVVLWKQGDPDGALPRFEQVIGENPASYAGAYVGRATIRFNRQQLADALGDFERAISIFQKQIADLEMKAITDDSEGRQGKVAAEHRRGLELNAELQRRSIRDGRGTS